MTDFRVEENPAPAHVQALQERLIAYNMAQTGAYDGRLLAIFLRDEQGEIVAGISGYTWAGFCEIEWLWVHEELRGQGYGSRMLAAAEQEALARGCSLIVLGTYSFQAPGFYQRMGYEVAGRIDDCPLHHTKYLLKKPLG
jgi:GNAT superfamily N-acetyltransferase